MKNTNFKKDRIAQATEWYRNFEWEDEYRIGIVIATIAVDFDIDYDEAHRIIKTVDAERINYK